MRALIYGIREQGKSTLALCLAAKARTDSGQLKTVIIFDPNAQYRMFPTVTTPEDFGAWLHSSKRSRIIVYQPTPGTIPDEFQAISDLLSGSRWDYANYVLLVDEAAVLQKANSMHPALERFLRQAPHSVDVIQTMHRQVDASTLARVLCTDSFYFYASHLRERQIAADQWGEEVANVIPRLGRHQFCHVWTSGGFVRYSIVRTPSLWYVRINDTARTRTGTGNRTGNTGA